MSDPRRAPDPRFAPTTTAVDFPALAEARRDDAVLAERAAAVGRARRDAESPRAAVREALGLADADVPVESVPAGGLDANGREPGARALVRRLDGTDRWGVLTDGRFWRLYGGGDPDEQRYHELDLRALVAASPNDEDAPLRRFAALFAREAFDDDGSESFLDALAAADATRRRGIRSSLGEGVVSAVETLATAAGGPPPDAAAAVVFRLVFDLFVADRTGSPSFLDGEGSDAFDAARNRLVTASRASPDGAAAESTLEPADRRILREWVAGAADSASDVPFAAAAASVDVDALGDDTLGRVCAPLASVSVDGRRVGADYRTVDGRLLADAHERLVDVDFDAEFDGPATRTTRRKADGSFYTPESVVRYLAARTAGSLVTDAFAAEGDAADFEARILDARVVDPAMGGGTLLVGVARRLAAGIRRSAREANAPVEPAAAVRRAVVSRCLYGVDRSPAATALARLVCLVETLGPETDPESLPDLTAHLRCGDALLGPGPASDRPAPTADAADDGAHPRPIRWEEAFSEVFDAENSGRGGVGFDAAVGNPPWKGTAGRAGVSARIDADTSAYLRTTFDSTDGPQPNLYAAFLERARRLAPDGYVAFVVPDALLVRLSVEPARRFLLESGGLTHLLRVGTVFPDANEGAAIVVCGPETTGDVRTWFGDADAFAAAVADDAFEYGRLRRETAASTEYARFQLLRDDVADGVFRKLERFEPLEAVATVARGEEFGKRDERVRTTPAPGTRRLLPGSAVRRYALRPRAVRHVPAAAVSKDVYDPPKLLCRQTGRYLVGTLDTEGVANLKSVYDVRVRGRPDAGENRLLSHLLGLLNSAVYNYYHYVRRNAYPAQFPQHNQRNYETLPVWSGSVDDELVSLVERRLDVGRTRASVDADVAAVVGFEDASVPVERFDPETVDDGLSRSHRGETPGLRIADLSVREARRRLTLRATYETAAGEATRDVFRFDAPTPRDALVLSTWLPAVGAATVTDRRACGLRPVGRSSATTPAARLRAVRVPDPETHAGALARYARDRRRAAALDRRAESLDARIDARVADLCGLSDAERSHVRETMAAAPGWASLRRPSG